MKKTKNVKKLPVNEKLESLENAKAIIFEREKEEIEECIKEFDASMKEILEKHNCRIVIHFQGQEGVCKSGIAIVKNK